jgi:eukaryotic-like serine/threonine-protein kinase
MLRNEVRKMEFGGPRLDHSSLLYLLRTAGEKPLLKGISLNTNRFLVVLVSTLIVGLVAIMPALFISSCSTSPSGGQSSSPTATLTAINTATNPYPPYKGTLTLNDSLRDNSKGYSWNELTQPDYGFCKFVGGAYHAEVSQNSSFFRCSTDSLNFSNSAYQVQMTILKGDRGGIVFRADDVHGSFYLFTFGIDGTYRLSIIKNHNFVKRVSAGSSPAIKTGYNQSNLIAVTVQGNSFDLYVNQQHIAHASDNTFSSGQIGIVADDISKPTEVAFNNAKVWIL